MGLKEGLLQICSGPSYLKDRNYVNDNTLFNRLIAARKRGKYGRTGL